MYAATEKGVEAFEQWMQRPVGKEPVRTELLAKIAVSRPDDAPRLLAAIEQYERASLEILESAAVAERPADGAAALGDELVDEAADQHVRAELAWAALARRRIAERAAELAG
jgi:DNA-binding PadR family transcriptional regulator